MNKYKLITIESVGCFENKKLGEHFFNIKATQEYISDVNMGHYKYIITATNEKEDILKVSSSCGAPREGKINEAFLKHELNRFWSEYKQYQRYLKDDVNG